MTGIEDEEILSPTRLNHSLLEGRESQRREMRTRRAVLFASVLVLACGALAPNPAVAATGEEIPDWVEVLPGATVEVVSDVPGEEVYIVREKADGSELRAAQGLSVGEATQVVDGVEATSYERLAAGCTQSQSMTNPLASVHVNNSGVWYIPGRFSFTRSSGCTDSFDWRASFWGYDTGFIGGEFGKVAYASTGPGETTTVYMSQVCRIHNKQYSWRTDMRTYSGSVLVATDFAKRSCKR